MVQFRLQEFDVVDCGLTDGLGRPVPSPLPAGSTVKHWADVQLARAWFLRANTIATDEGALAAAIAGGSRAQWNYLSSIGSALMNAYNAANIPWSSSPNARRLWRAYLSGPPTDYNRNIAQADFGKTDNYNAAWFKPGETWPYGGLKETSIDGQSGDVRHFTGSIPAAAERAFRAGYYDRGAADRHRLQFVMPFGPMIVAQRPDAQGRPVRYVETAFDWINAWPARPPAPGVDPTSGAYLSAGQRFYGIDNAVATAPAPPGGGTVWNDYAWDQATNVFGLGEPDVTAALQVAAPLKLYYDWLRDWAAAEVARPVVQLVACARGFVIYRNTEAMKSVGGAGQWMSEVSTQPGQVQADLVGVNPSVGVAIQTTAAIGAVVGVAVTAANPVAGAVVAVVVGAGVAIATVMNSSGLFAEGVRDRGRDDLGRFKPQMERAWLSGDPSVEPTDTSGIPRQPVPNVPSGAPDAPGGGWLFDPNSTVSFTDYSTLITMTPEAARGTVGAFTPEYSPPPDSLPRQASGVQTAVKVVLVGGLVYGVYRLVKGR